MATSHLKHLGLAVAAVLLVPALAASGGRGKDSVCVQAGLIGSAYAACHTYCESLDCDAADHSASDRACEQALARYLDLSGGENPPCIVEDEPPGGDSGCPCSIGWNDPGLLPEGWEPADCHFYDSGEGGVSVSVFGDPGFGKDVFLSAGWFAGEYEWGNSAGFNCSWSSSNSDVGKFGNFDFGDQDRAPADPIDSTGYQELYALCEADLEAFLARYGWSLDDCAVNPEY